jgi:hypothetical protein
MTTEQEDLEAELVYWRELADLVGWRVQGWSFRKTASYLTEEDQVLQLTGAQRDALVTAIKRRA